MLILSKMAAMPLRHVRVVLLLLVASAWIVNALDAIWSLSIDLPHHYALVARLTELWTLPYSGDPSLGEMNAYPRLSHIAAAVAGRFVGSALLGMQTITLLGIASLWIGLISILLSLPTKARLIAAIGWCALLWLNRQFLHLDLHAGEVIGNFFYAQLVTQAFIVVMVAVSLYLERTGVSPLMRYALLGAAVYVSAGIHLLPALELLAFLAALMGIELLHRARAGSLSWANAALALLWLSTVGTALYAHPSVAIMSSLSANNGGISGPIQSMGAFLAYSAIHLVGSGCVLAAWFWMSPPEQSRHWLGLKYIGLYGLAAAGLCLLQVLAYKLGHGSEYAVKKYIFALNTSALLEIVMCIAWVLGRRTPGVPQASSSSTAKTLQCVLAPALLLVSLHCVTPTQSALKTSSLVKLEQQLLLRRDLYLPSAAGKFDYIQGIKGLPPVVDYMMSIGVLKAPRVTTQLATPVGWNWDLVGTLITSENAEFDQDPTCRRAAPASALVMLDGACIGKRYPRRHIIGFTSNHPPSPCIAQGLSVAESFGTWTADATASLRCPLPSASELTQRTLQIDAAGFLIKMEAQRVSVNLQGQPPVNYLFDTSHPEHLISLKLPPGTAQEVQIHFSLPDARSPKELGLSDDGRKLGIAIRTLEFK